METTSGAETGHTHVNESSQFQRDANRLNKQMAIQQGVRRRHPHRVLGQFQGVNSTTSSASTMWEQALVHETKKVDMPQDFRPKGDTEGMSNQMGLVSTALENYKNSKNKLQRLHLVGS